MRIPDNKHIRFICSACDRNYEYKDGERIRRKYWVPIASALLIFTGFIANELYPIPYLLGLSSFFWWLFKRSRNKIKKLISNLSSPTALGLAIVFIIQLIINLIHKPKDLEIPHWLLQFDNGLLWIRQHLTYLSEISLGSYLLVIIALLFVAIKKPTWKPISKLKALEGRIGKVTFIIIVVTSFTFFAPKASDALLDQSFYNYYQVHYREQLKQDRVALIADALRERLEDEEWDEYSEHLEDLSKTIVAIPKVDFTNTYQTEKDIKEVMRMAGLRSIKTLNPLTLQVEYSSHSNTRDHWKRDSEEWKKRDKTAPKEKKSNRRSVTETQIKRTKKATMAASEATEGLKTIFVKFCGAITPELANPLKNYIDEVVNTTAEYLFDTSNVDRLVNQFFNDSRKNRRLAIFSKIAAWKTNTDDKIAEAQRQKEIEKERIEKMEERALISENNALYSSIEESIKALDLGLSQEDWLKIKTELENKHGKSFSTTETNTLVKDYYNGYIFKKLARRVQYKNEIEKNNILKNLQPSIKGSLNLVDFINFFYGQYLPCPQCRMPMIPGTPCITIRR